MRVLTDFHHSSLLRATNMLFGSRLGMEVFRPIGMDWFEEGFWAINDQLDTAMQFLRPGSQPLDDTPELNDSLGLETFTSGPTGKYRVMDPGGRTSHMACTLEFFKNNQFDYVIASIPEHVKPMQKLINLYNKRAKLIIQVGNNWNLGMFEGLPVLASVAPQLAPSTVHFYRQEFDIEVFHSSPVEANSNVYSFVNVIQKTGVGWNDFNALKTKLGQLNFRAFGGQCPDGNMTGPNELADKMREAMLIFHVKPGGDGFGHIIHNAYAVGRPIITRPSHYAGHLAADLLVPGTFIDLDKLSVNNAAFHIAVLATTQPDKLIKMGEKASARFREVVNFEMEAQGVSRWLQNLN